MELSGKEDCELLSRASQCWGAWESFRTERERCKRFTYGDQWIDTVEDRGVRMREEDLIRRQGNLPLKNNLIRRLVRNVLGLYRNRWKMPLCMARDPAEQPRADTVNALLECNAATNRLEELYARSMEEFLIGGLVVHKKWYGLRDGRVDCWTTQVSPARFFVDTRGLDFRGSDISLIGEVHDMHLEDLLASFAKTPEHASALAGIYGVRQSDRTARCRVWEVWERRRMLGLECHDRSTGRCWTETDPEAEPRLVLENMERAAAGRAGIEMEWCSLEVWRYAFLSEGGRILDEGDSPYEHGAHPYVFKGYPYIDGEIHSFVSDIIDQQKLTNRLISMYDWVLRASAKGVLLFPEGSLPDGADLSDVAGEWSRFNGVIVYKPRPGVPLPQQVSANNSDIGITGLLEIQMKMMEDISGVNGALQGKLDSGSMSGTLYNQQTQNSLSALADLLKSFDDFMRTATSKDVANIRQFYSPGRVAAIAGRAAADLSGTRDFYDPCLDFRIKL